MSDQDEQPLFRPEYIRARSQEAMGTLSVNPTRAVSFAALGSALVSILMIVLLANLPYTRVATLAGQLTRGGNSVLVQSSFNGPVQVIDVLVLEGDRTIPGTELMRVRSQEESPDRLDSISGNFLVEEHGANGFTDRSFTLIAIRGGAIEAVMIRPGQFVAPGQPMLTVRQEQGSLSVMTYVPSKALRGFEEGKEVSIRVDAFPQQRFGTLHGIVKKVGDSSLNPYQVAEKLGTAPPSEPMFRVDVDIDTDQEFLRRIKSPLKSGMKVEMDVPVESGTMMSWLLRRGRP